MALPKARTLFVTVLRESLNEKSEFELSQEAGLEGFNRIQPALTNAGVSRIKCIDWKPTQAIFEGLVGDQFVRFICVDNGGMLKVKGLLDVDDDGEFAPITEDLCKWSDDLIKFFGKLIYKTVRAK